MSTIEVKASFKNINIKDKTVLQFELSPRFLDQLPELTKMANTSVFLSIESEQQELPIDVEEEFEQPTIPEDDVEEEFEMLELPAPGLEPGDE